MLRRLGANLQAGTLKKLKDEAAPHSAAFTSPAVLAFSAPRYSRSLAALPAGDRRLGPGLRRRAFFHRVARVGKSLGNARACIRSLAAGGDRGIDHRALSCPPRSRRRHPRRFRLRRYPGWDRVRWHRSTYWNRRAEYGK